MPTTDWRDVNLHTAIIQLAPFLSTVVCSPHMARSTCGMVHQVGANGFNIHYFGQTDFFHHDVELKNNAFFFLKTAYVAQSALEPDGKYPAYCTGLTRKSKALTS